MRRVKIRSKKETVLRRTRGGVRAARTTDVYIGKYLEVGKEGRQALDGTRVRGVSNAQTKMYILECSTVGGACTVLPHVQAGRWVEAIRNIY